MTQYANSVSPSRVPSLFCSTEVGGDCALLAEKSIVCVLQEDFKCLCGVRSKGSNRSTGYTGLKVSEGLKGLSGPKVNMGLKVEWVFSIVVRI